MNILGAIFPLDNFIDLNNLEQSISDHLKSSFPFARTCLLRGDADQCFRSLFFQAAISYATIGKRVNFYSLSSIQTLPSLVHSLIPKSLSNINLNLIQFHYLSTLKDVHKHLINSSCDIIIIDGYLEYPLCKQEDHFKIISACALLKDTYDYLKQEWNKKDLILLCSCTCSESIIEKRSLFDLTIQIEMLEDGDYQANLNKNNISCAFTFRFNQNEIMPLRVTIQQKK